ncbi:MAG TPA: tagatose-6-phosphate ketose isomerase [Terriglobales bacterium]|nr:tagatose-6-phosphate ketose isomerase [Terriglobales bacterium]
MDALARLLNTTKEDKTEKGFLYTPAEIAQQPATWPRTFEIFRKRRAELREFLSGAGFNFTAATQPTLVLVGAGTSDYIGKSVVRLLRRQWNCDAMACPSTDLITQMEEILRPDRRYLCLSFSRSGDSSEGVAVLERILARRPDIHHLVVSCNRDGKMIKIAQGSNRAFGICLDDAVNDRGLAMTSSYSNMVVLGQALAHIETPEEYSGILQKLIDAAKTFVPRAADFAADLAQRRFKKACFVGTGTLRAVAQESALKLLEMTAGRILTMSESALGLRHGPMAALDHDTLFVSFLSGDERIRRLEENLLREIGGKKLVRTRIAVTANSRAAMDGRVDDYLFPEAPAEVGDDHRAPVDVIFGQLLGLFSSLACGLKPDAPSPSGAIGRVVQNLDLH